MRILICGDSFSADWSSKIDSHGTAWWQLLGQNHVLENRSQAGCSEYKIWLQITQGLEDFDRVLVFHTSPYRIYVKQHPYLDKSPLHNNSDLIYNDIINHDFPDRECLAKFFEKYFDLGYADFVHDLIMEKIKQYTKDIKTLHVGRGLPGLDLDINDLFTQHRGDVNHLTKKGNQILFEKINNWIAG